MNTPTFRCSNQCAGCGVNLYPGQLYCGDEECHREIEKQHAIRREAEDLKKRVTHAADGLGELIRCSHVPVATRLAAPKREMPAHEWDEFQTWLKEKV